MNNKVKEFATDINVGTTRTNWDVLREDKQKAAEKFITYDVGVPYHWWCATLSDSRHTTRKAAIAANLAWLDAEVGEAK